MAYPLTGSYVSQVLGWFETLDPFPSVEAENKGMAILLNVIVDIFQIVVSYLLFGCSDIHDGDCEDVLPSRRNQVLSLKEARDGNIYHCTGCDPTFEGEIVYYGAVHGLLSKLFEAFKDSIPALFNVPFTVIKTLLDIVNDMFQHMNNVCSWIGGFVGGSYGESTYENTRLVLHEIGCRKFQ